MVKLYKNKGKRPTEKYSIRQGKTIIAIIPDYINVEFIKRMVVAMNCNHMYLDKPDILN